MSARTRSPSSAVRNKARDYAELKTIPAALSVGFVVLGAFSFGAIDAVTWNWFFNYTLTPEHAAIGSLAVMLVAFMSSETRSLEYYDDWEQYMMLATPIVIVGNQWIAEFTNVIVTPYEPWSNVVLFLVTLGGWFVMVR